MSKASVQHSALAAYVTGFVLSVGLTLAAYLFVTRHASSARVLLATIAVLAAGQFLVQLFFFLHLGQEKKPRWNLTVLLFTVLVLLIIVFGSLWIMNHLDYNMSPQAASDSIMQDEGIH